MIRANLLKRKLQRMTQSGPLDRGTALNTIQAPHIANRLMKGLGVREMAPVPEMSRELVPVILVDDLSKDSARDDLEGYWAMRVSVTAAAGEFAAIGLRNISADPGSKTLYDLIIDSVYIDSSAAVACHYGRYGVLAGTAQTTPIILENKGRSDEGSGDTSTAAEVFAGDLVAVVPGFTHRGGGGGAEWQLFDLNFTIPPGLFFYVIHPTAAGTLDCTIHWRERARRQ